MPRCFHSPEWPTGAHRTWNFSVMPTGVDLDATEATPATPNPQTEIPQSRHSMLCSPRKDCGLMKWRCEMSNRAAQLLKISRRMMLTKGSQLRCLRALLLSFVWGCLTRLQPNHSLCKALISSPTNGVFRWKITTPLLQH